MHKSATTLEMKFSIKDFFSKCQQIRGKLQVCSYLLKEFLSLTFAQYANISAFNSFFPKRECLFSHATVLIEKNEFTRIIILYMPQ